MNYQFELTENRYKPRQATSLHLITGFAMTGIGAFTFLLGNANWVQTVFHAPIISGTILGTISLSYGLLILFFTLSKNNWLLQNNKKMRLANAAVTAILAIIFALSQWWLAAGIAAVAALANAYAYFYEQKAVQALVVSFGDKLIILPATSRRKQLEWKEVERVILRHGILTIDCADNFLFQWNVKKNETDSRSFEDYCAANIMANKSNRNSDDW